VAPEDGQQLPMLTGSNPTVTNLSSASRPLVGVQCTSYHCGRKQIIYPKWQKIQTAKYVIMSIRKNISHSSNMKVGCRKYWNTSTRRAFGRADVPPTNVFPWLAVDKTILKPRLSAVMGGQYLYMGFSWRNNIPCCSAYDIGESNPVPAFGL